MFRRRSRDFNEYLTKRFILFSSFGFFFIILFVFIISRYSIAQRLEELWAYICFGLASIFFTFAFKFYYQKNVLSTIHKKLLLSVDEICNRLITVIAPDSLKEEIDGFPKLLRDELENFGEELLICFCDKKLFKSIAGGFIYLASENLPSHKNNISIHPDWVKQYYTDDLKIAIEYYVYTKKETNSLFITRSKDLTIQAVKTTDTKRTVDLLNKDGEKIDYSKIAIPTEICTITPININNEPLGYLALFHEKQPFLLRLYQSEPAIDVFIIERLENWKLDDVVKSIFQRELLTYTIFLILKLDEYDNNLLVEYDTIIKNKQEFLRKIITSLCKYFSSPIGYFYVGDEKIVDSKSGSSDLDTIENILLPNLTRHLNRLSINEIRAGYYDVASLGFGIGSDLINKFIIYIPIKFKEVKNGKTQEIYFGHFGFLRAKTYNQFDLMILSILEECKIDNIIKALYNGKT